MANELDCVIRTLLKAEEIGPPTSRSTPPNTAANPEHDRT